MLYISACYQGIWVKMMRQGTWIMTCVVILLMMVAVSPNVKGEVVIEKPNPAVGDYWNYAYVYPGYNGSLGFKVVDIKDVISHGQSYKSYVMDAKWKWYLDMSGMNVTYTGAETVYRSVSDYALLRYSIHIELNSTQGWPFGNETQDCSYGYPPPLKETDFPIKVSKKWSASSTIDAVCTGVQNGTSYGPMWSNFTESYNYTAESSAKITVPAGTFDTIAINQSQSIDYANFTFYMNTYFSPEVGEMVEITAYNDTPFVVLTSYKYSGNPDASANSNLILGLQPTIFYSFTSLIVLVLMLSIVLVFLLLKRRGSAGSEVAVPENRAEAIVMAAQAPGSFMRQSSQPSPTDRPGSGITICPKCRREIPSTRRFCYYCSYSRTSAEKGGNR